MVAEQELSDAIAEGRALSASNRHLGALRHFAAALDRHGETAGLLTAAADAWVVAVDARAPLSDWAGCDDFHLRLIRQQQCDISPPILQHRIASQHSSGVKGHLARAAAVLEPVLQKLTASGSIDHNGVLALLLLRAFLGAPDQQKISALHRQYFAGFGPEDLAVPYSVMFEPSAFNRNVADLAKLVADDGPHLLGGAMPLVQLLLLEWLVPDSFAAMPGDWAAQAIRARREAGLLGGKEAAAARSLAIRFGGDAHRALAAEGVYGEPNPFTAALNSAESARLAFSAPGGAANRAQWHLAATPWQAVNAARNLAAARAPALLRASRRRPKVAICVSGQLRGFRAAWPSWQKTLLASIDATIFVDSWSRIGRASAEPFRYVLPFEGARFVAQYREIGIELGLSGLEQRYPALFATLAESDDISEAELSSFYNTPHVHLDDESDPRFAGFSNPDKMHYKIEQCYHQVVASGDQFDLIVRIRPDKPVKLVGFDWADMLRATGDTPLIYCESAMGVHYANLSMGDQFAVCAPQAGKVYFETYSRAAAFSHLGLHLFHRELTGHVSLAQMCWLHGIAVRRAPVKFGLLQDPAPLPSRSILAALERDAAGRNDALDRKLIAAAARDIAGG